jgi:hypothetical protein
MSDLLEAALADVLTQGGSKKLAKVLRGLAERGHVEPYLENGEYGFRSTDKGMQAVLARRPVRGHG